MPEYVYALHNFLPEYEDELSFVAGELIEVIEKDDTYADSWWQGRNPAGGVGLFPVSYTTPAPSISDTSHALHSPEPVSGSHSISTSNGKFVLQPLTEESEPEASGVNILSPPPKNSTTSLLNSDYHHNTELFRDGENSENSDADFDLSDFDGTTEINGNGASGEDWRKAARRKLVAKAKRAVEEAEKLESMMGVNENGRRAAAPPIEVDFSDESEVEDDAGLTRSSNFRRDHRHSIPDEDGNLGTNGEVTATTNGIHPMSRDVLVPLEDETDIPTATKLSFSAPQTPVPTDPLPEESEEKTPIEKDISPRFISPPTDGEPTAATNGARYSLSNHVFVPPNDDTHIPTTTKPSFSASQTPAPTEPLPEEPEDKSPIEKDIHSSPISPPTMTLPSINQILKGSGTPVRAISNGLPSPTSVGHHHDIISSKHNMTSSNASLLQVQPQQQQPNSTSVSTGSASIPVSTTVQGRNETPPMEWSIKEVIDWLKSKGFDQNTCDKFNEQEITGDVLLELDVNLLKSEIGIMAFGKRMRIAKAITDFRRPLSIEYSDHQLSPTQLHHSNSLAHSHSRTQNQSPSLLGTIPATSVGLVQSYSTQSSYGNPGAGYGGQQQSGGHLQDSPLNINDDMKVAGPVVVPVGNGTAAGVAAGVSAATRVGLGIALSPKNGHPVKGPPSRLLLSSSNAALKESTARMVSVIAVNGEDEEPGHMSDGEVVLNSASMRPRTLGVSHESVTSTAKSSSRPKSLHLSSPNVLGRDNVKEKETSDKDTSTVGIRHARSRRSVGIFEAAFGSTLGKSRKPPPSSDDTLIEKASIFSLPRLHSSGIHKSSLSASRRLSTFNGPGSDQKRSHPNPKPNVTTGIRANAPENMNGGSGFIKQGANIVDRIGEPDYAGWMRKRGGDRYNSWKRRYFILKGPHLYFLKSDNKSETRIKGYILIVGYRVTVDENVNPGRYGFRIDHDHDQTHYFSSEERGAIRDWMKAIMKATILRDFSYPVVSSCNIPTVPLVVAQAMNPTPRPPSPSARKAIQKALRRENTEQLSKRDTLILGLSITDIKQERVRLDSLHGNGAVVERERNPSRPPRKQLPVGRMNSVRSVMSQADDSESLIKWANTHLPESLQITDSTGVLCTGLGLGLHRLAESIKGQPSSPPVPDSAFPTDIHDDKLDGLFRLFDFLLDNGVKMGSVSINDVRLGKRDMIIQILKALKAWEDKQKAHDLSIALKAAPPAPFMLM